MNDERYGSDQPVYQRARARIEDERVRESSLESLGLTNTEVKRIRREARG